MTFPFYRQAVDSQISATPAYLDYIHRLFHDDRASGMVQVQLAADRQAVLFYHLGEVCQAYQQHGGGGEAIDPARARAGWQTDERPLRSLNLPPDALRVALQAVEWHPVQLRQEVRAAQLGEFLQACKSQRLSGLLEITSAGMDGFILLWKGDVVGTETVFSTPTGFQSSLPGNVYLQDHAGELWQVSFYPANPGSDSYARLLLRLGWSSWLGGMLDHYQVMVGQSLVSSLDRDLNALARMRGWAVQAVGSAVIERDFFTETGQAAQVYRSLLRLALAQVSQVIGSGLAFRLMEDTFTAVDEDERRFLSGQDLTPGSLQV